MRAAAIQMAPVFKAKELNLKRMLKLGKVAADSDVNLIVFPELCTTGYSLMSEQEARPLAEVVGPGGMSFDAMALLAKSTSAFVVWGTIEVDAGTQRIYNSQVCVCPEGNWIRYAKVNRWGNDFLWAEEGRGNPPVLTTPFGKLGLLICRDVRDKKDSKWESFYEKGDADIVAFSANWGRGGFPAVAWMQFVKDNNTALVVANRYGEEEHNDFGHGGACVINKQGKVFCDGLAWDRDCVVVGDL